MPALRLVIVEGDGRLEARFRAAVAGRSAEVFAVRDPAAIFESTRQEGRTGLLLIEHQGDLEQTVALLEQAERAEWRSIVFVTQPILPAARLLLRTAGAMLLLDRMPAYEQIEAWTQRWIGMANHPVA
jgi:hypothetical protein